MRVLIAVQHFPPRYVGGVEIYTDWLVGALSALGCEVIVVALDGLERQDGPSILVTETEQSQRVKVFQLSMLQAEYWSFEASIRNDAIGRWFQEKLEDFKPDIVHVQSGYRLSGAPLEAAIAYARSRVVVTLHDYWYICPSVNLLRADGGLCDGCVTADECIDCMRHLHENGSRGAEDWMARTDHAMKTEMIFRSEYLRRLLRDADVVISPTRHLSEVYRTAGFDFRDLRVVNIGIDRKLFPVNRSAARTQRRRRIGFVGSLLHHKGAHVLADAVERLHAAAAELKCSIYGSRAAQPAYSDPLFRRYASHPAIDFEGGYALHQLPQILKGIDVVVVPSLWPENSPLVILEALACRTPVIAANIGAVREFVTDGVNGLLFRAGDARDLAQKIDRAYSDGVLETLAAGASYQRDSRQECEEILGIYHDLIQRVRE